MCVFNNANTLHRWGSAAHGDHLSVLWTLALACNGVYCVVCHRRRAQMMMCAPTIMPPPPHIHTPYYMFVYMSRIAYIGSCATYIYIYFSAFVLRFRCVYIFSRCAKVFSRIVVYMCFCDVWFCWRIIYNLRCMTHSKAYSISTST